MHATTRFRSRHTTFGIHVGPQQRRGNAQSPGLHLRERTRTRAQSFRRFQVSEQLRAQPGIGGSTAIDADSRPGNSRSRWRGVSCEQRLVRDVRITSKSSDRQQRGTQRRDHRGEPLPPGLTSAHLVRHHSSCYNSIQTAGTVKHFAAELTDVEVTERQTLADHHGCTGQLSPSPHERSLRPPRILPS